MFFFDLNKFLKKKKKKMKRKKEIVDYLSNLNSN